MQDAEKAHRGVIASRIKVQRADAYALSHRSLRPLWTTFLTILVLSS